MLLRRGGLRTMRPKLAATLIIMSVFLLALAVSACGEEEPDPVASLNDKAVAEGLKSIQIGIESLSVDYNDVPPQASDVSATGQVGQLVDHWPANPFTGLPMSQGTGEGDFTCETDSTGATYTLIGYGSGGREVARSTGPDSEAFGQ